MKIVNSKEKPFDIKAVVFDFDGTISTLRHGWEMVMEPMMIEMISGGRADAIDEITDMVRSYIDESTGIQTVYQMKWLAKKVLEYGNAADNHDEWWYKAEYLRRLMEEVDRRKQSIESGVVPADDYIIAGSVAFLSYLKNKGIAIYAASGTDHPDVVREAGILGVGAFFDEIAGAPVDKADCSKDKVIKKLLDGSGYKGENIAVIGDGKVEISLGRQFGTLTLGLASDEAVRSGINPIKEKRLTVAGAHAIAGDFLNESILEWMGLK